MPAYVISDTATAHLILIRAITEVIIGQVIAGSPIKPWSTVLTIINISLALPTHIARGASAVEAIEKILKDNNY